MDRRTWLKLSGITAAGSLTLPGFAKYFMHQQMSTLTKDMFGKEFAWGVATAAYQIEGAHNLDGKGPSVWDVFTHTKGKIRNEDHGDIACDFYHRYKEDIQLMKQMNIPNFRFSLSWSRILPDGTGKINQPGLDFYHRVIDECHRQGLEPWITLYHWDLPQALEAKGGWTNRKILNWFTEYVQVCTKAFGKKVKHWMVLNEPMAFVGAGYQLGLHAPGRKGFKNFLPAAHHATLCQADGGRIIRQNVPGAKIGSTFSASHIMPASDSPKHRKAVARFDAVFNRFFLEPALGMSYPYDAMPVLKRIEKHFQPGDEERMIFDFDFIGLQNYTREVVKKHFWPPVVWGKIVEAEKRGVETTDMKWEVYPEGIYHILKKFSQYPSIKEIIVTENGAAFPDKLEGEFVHDPKRTRYLQDYLGQVLRAKQDGVNVTGYFVWTFMDNFEWAEGYTPRFGLVHVDFTTQKRRIKDSGLWYKEFLTR